jgi:hypothetical protein
MLSEERRQGMRDPLRPPEQMVARELSKAALRVARLKVRVRAQRKKLEDLDAELVAASRVLRDLARDATSPAPSAEPEQEPPGS